MDNNNKHINTQSKHSSKDEWIKYLNRELSEADAHALEKMLLDDEFELEAMEGLEQLKQPDQIDDTLHSIKQSILKKAQKNKNSRRKIQLFGDIKWGILTLIILILIIVCAMVIINLLSR